jgi:glutamate synthase domain-containing protein 2
VEPGAAPVTGSGLNASAVGRYSFFVCCAVAAILAGVWFVFVPGASTGFLVVALIACVLTTVGVADLWQQPRAVLRNYPVLGHLRYMLESIRPEIRQYLLEGDHEKLPFSRAQRSLVYQRAKNAPSEKAFGTLTDVYGAGHEFISHSIRPVHEASVSSFRVRVGGEQCAQPYDASILNISAMSFGALSANAIRALNRGARMGDFAHDTGEGSISPYHREFGGDLIWEVASGYFGCRSADGKFNAAKFAEQANLDQVKMIEVKLSQGAKPGHGGILPAHKVSAEIAATRGVPAAVDCISPASHSAFDSPAGLLRFIAQLRELSGGKPTGFKICIGHVWEFTGIVKAMLETGIVPDFIVVDGAEGGTGAAPLEFVDHVGMPMREGLLFVHNVLVGAGLRAQVKVGASGKIISAFDIARALALGADWVNSARGFMFAVGCIQSQNCHTNRCPTGVATQDPLRQRALVPEDKAGRVHNFHRNTLTALAQMLAAAGLKHPSELRPHHMARREAGNQIRLYSQLHTFLEPGELLAGASRHAFYTSAWHMGNASSFTPAPDGARSTAVDSGELWAGKLLAAGDYPVR